MSNTHDDRGPDAENAMLRAAAPDLLKALQAILDTKAEDESLESDYINQSEYLQISTAFDKARAAVASATGAV